MKICDVFEVVINSDLTEGRGRDYVCARFFNESVAKEFAKGRDVMGSDGKVQIGQVVAMDTGSGENFYPLQAAVPVYKSITEKARAELLERFTLEERKLLGLA
jgi:hypothetical protein